MIEQDLSFISFQEVLTINQKIQLKQKFESNDNYSHSCSPTRDIDIVLNSL
jgi:hypothetical protein